MSAAAGRCITVGRVDNRPEFGRDVLRPELGRDVMVLRHHKRDRAMSKEPADDGRSVDAVGGRVVAVGGRPTSSASPRDTLFVDARLNAVRRDVG